MSQSGYFWSEMEPYKEKVEIILSRVSYYQWWTSPFSCTWLKDRDFHALIGLIFIHNKKKKSQVCWGFSDAFTGLNDLLNWWKLWKIIFWEKEVKTSLFFWILLILSELLNVLNRSVFLRPGLSFSQFCWLGQVTATSFEGLTWGKSTFFLPPNLLFLDSLYFRCLDTLQSKFSFLFPVLTTFYKFILHQFAF